MLLNNNKKYLFAGFEQSNDSNGNVSSLDCLSLIVDSISGSGNGGSAGGGTTDTVAL